MKTILELIAELKGKLTGVELSDEARDLIGQIYSQGEDILSSLRTANAEAKDFRLKVTALEKDKEKLSGELETEKTAHETTKTKLATVEPQLAELATYKQGKETELRTKWAELVKVFDVKETDPNFKKIQQAREFFVFPKDDKTPLTADELQANMTAHERLSKLGTFGEYKPDKPPLDKSKGQESNDADKASTRSYFSDFDTPAQN